MTTKNKDPFEDMTDQESIDFQVEQWVAGNSLHNTVRDECCPDFSCCGLPIQPKAVRDRFWEAYQEGDQLTMDAICFSALGSMLAIEFDDDVYIVTAEQQVH